MKPISLQNRMLFTVVVGLLVLGITHLAISFFHENLLFYTKQKQLSDYAYALGRAIKIENDHFYVTQTPNPRFLQLKSGLGAVVFEDGKAIWTSPSVEKYPSLPQALKDGAKKDIFEPGSEATGFHKFITPVSVNSTDGRLVSVFVFEESSSTSLIASAFKDAVYYALFVAFVLILAAQTFTARWFMNPFRRMEKELNEIRRGQKKTFEEVYPPEIQTLADSINTLVFHETEQADSYRNSLSNLAHSLKTPLAVLKNSMDDPDDDLLRQSLRQQVDKIDGIVMYQLALASRSGKQTFATPILLKPLAEDIVEGLEKIYAQKGTFCEFEIEEDISFPANKGDMQELLGNLLENAFKWSNSRVLLTMKREEKFCRIMVEDDGRGVPPEKVSVIMERGIRADEQVQGHGVGLAIVADIIRSYQGHLSIEGSEELGGALFNVTLPYDK